MYWILLISTLFALSLICYFVAKKLKQTEKYQYKYGIDYLKSTGEVLSWIFGIVFIFLLLVVSIHQSDACKYAQQRDYAELSARLEASYVNPVTQEDGYVLRYNITSFNKKIRTARYYNDRPWGGWFVRKDLETFSLLDYRKIKFKTYIQQDKEE